MQRLIDLVTGKFELADVVATVTLLLPAKSYSSKGQVVQFELSEDNHQLIGSTINGNVIEINITDAGDYTVKLLDIFEHADLVEGDIYNFDISIYILDRWGDYEYGKLQVETIVSNATNSLMMFPDLAKLPLNFYISDGEKSESEIVSYVKGVLNSPEVGLIFIPEEGKILIGNNNHFASFVGSQVGAEAGKVSVEAVISSDGDILSDVSVIQVDGNTFEINIPPELVGTSYKIVLSESPRL